MEIVREVVELRNQIALDKIEAIADDLVFLMRGVIEIQIGEMKFELQAGRDVGDAERLDDAVPLNGVKALLADREPSSRLLLVSSFTVAAPGAVARANCGIFRVEKLAIVEAVPELGASAGGGVELALERFAQRDVVDGQRNADLRSGGGSGSSEACDCGDDDYPQPDAPSQQQTGADEASELTRCS